MRHVIIILSAGAMILAGGCATQNVDPQSSASNDLREAKALARYATGILDEFHYGETSKEAIEEYKTAIGLDPTTHNSYSRAALLHFQRKETEEAIELLRESCRKNPDNASAWLDLAGICDISGRFNDAIEAASHALKLLPSDATIAIQVAKLHLNKGDDNSAIRVIKKSMKNQASRPILLRYCLVQGNTYLDRGEIKRAIPYFNMLIEQTPEKKEELYHLLGMLYQSLGYDKEAARNFRLALKTDTPIPASFVMLAGVQARENMEDALKTLRGGEKKLPGNFNIISALGALYCMDKQNDAAIRTFEAMRALPGASTNLTTSFFYYYGAAYEQSGQIEKAEKIFEEGIKLFPANHEAMNYLAYMWADKGIKLEQAEVYVKKALILDPANPAYMDTLGWVYFKQKRFAEAFDLVHRASKLMDDDSTLNEHLGDIKMAMGSKDSAIEYWKQSFLLDPGNNSVASKLELNGISTKDLTHSLKQKDLKSGKK